MRNHPNFSQQEQKQYSKKHVRNEILINLSLASDVALRENIPVSLKNQIYG